MRLLALDPGLTTGYAIFCNGHIERCGHCISLEDVVDLCLQGSVARTLGEKSYDAIVYEGFARGNSVVDEQLRTIELCGAIQAAAHLGRLKCTMQYPAMRKGYVPIAKCIVKELGFTYEEMHHAIDAVAHALCYMDKEGIEWAKQRYLRKAFPSVD